MEISDLELVESIKKDQCSPCIKELRNRHLGLIISIYNRYGNILNVLNYKNADFNDEINYIIFESARKFDFSINKIKFSTYLGEQVRFFCLNKINELNKNKSINSSPENIIKIIDDCFNNNTDNLNSELCDYIFSILEQIKDERVYKIFKLRYFTSSKSKMTWKEIAAKMDPPITNQTCLNIHNKTIKFLKSKILSKIEHDKI